jgi:hypothetical protein
MTMKVHVAQILPFSFVMFSKLQQISSCTTFVRLVLPFLFDLFIFSLDGLHCSVLVEDHRLASMLQVQSSTCPQSAQL